MNDPWFTFNVVLPGMIAVAVTAGVAVLTVVMRWLDRRPAMKRPDQTATDKTGTA